METPAELDNETIRLLCEATITLYRRSRDYAKANGNARLHKDDPVLIHRLDAGRLARV